MGLFTRPESAYWWVYLETARKKERTRVLLGETAAQRKDNKAVALEYYHQRMRELARRVHHLSLERPAIRFAAYATTYETDVVAAHKGAARERELLKLLVVFFGGDLLSLIDRGRVAAYVTWRKATNAQLTAGTINREIDLLKAMLRDAVPTYLESSPIAGLPKLKGPKATRRLLQPAEERRLLAVAKADPQDYALIVLAQDTLARLGDCLALRRADRSGSWVRIRDPKNGVPYDVPLSPRAAKALDAIDHDQDYYFEKFRRAIAPRDWRGSVRQRLEYLCAAAKVPCGKAEGGITFHGATRKTGATRLVVAKGVAVPVVQQLGNWKRPDVLLTIYTQAQRGDLLRAVGRKRG